MRKDWFLFLAIILIVTFGLTTLYSTVVGEESLLGGGVFNRQLLFVLISMLVYFGLSYFDYRFLGNTIVLGPAIIVVVLMLTYVLFFGVEINYARRWLVVGGIQLQPSEFAKLVLLVSSAWILSMRYRYSVWILAAISAALALLFSLLIFFEPDAGTTIVMLGIWVMLVFSVLPNQLFNASIVAIALATAVSVICYLSGNIPFGVVMAAIAVAIAAMAILLGKKLKLLAIAAIAFGILLGFGGTYMWNNVLHDYQKDRIETFINPSGKSQDEGFQVEQSKVAIGSGLLWGKGFGLGTQSKLRFLPEHQTDFIFATFAEEFGLIGSISLLVLYAVVIMRVFRAAVVVENSFGSLICLAIGTKLMVEVFINIGMNMGIVPATGVPLPLMSAGGSMFLVTMAGLGLVQSTLVHRDD